jgi:DNA-binding XRE family transcriptional regulator
MGKKKQPPSLAYAQVVSGKAALGTPVELETTLATFSDITTKAQELKELVGSLRVERQQQIPLTEFGRAVAETRNNNDLTQETLAALADISIGTLQRIENGSSSPSLEKMVRLGNALGIKLWLTI